MSCDVTGDTAAEAWTKIHSLLCCTHRVGHALLAALLCQNLACSDSAPPVNKTVCVANCSNDVEQAILLTAKGMSLLLWSLASQ